MNPEFNKIREDGRLLMEFVRGSTLYGLNTPTSDVDTGGVYIATPEEVMGFLNYKEQVSDAKHDNTWYELGNFIELLMKANPNILEALFVPEDKIIGDIHPFMKMLRDNKEEFLTKKCFNTFFGYATSQVHKARGLNKKIVNPVKERLGPLDFVYTFYKQGSTKVKNWLAFRGMYQRYCGLVNIPNMRDTYGMYYDFGNHALNVPNWELDKAFLNYVITLTNPDITYDNIDTIEPILYGYAIEWVKSQKPLGYSGIIAEEKDTTELKLSSIDDKDDRPIAYISYNEDGFKKHCREYHDYKEWEKNRNPVRYESNLNKNYDSKNMMHCFRLIHMGKEIAEGKGVNLVRTWDRQFLMDVRNHKYEYDELIEMLDKEIEEMNEVMRTSTLPEEVNKDKINNLLIEIRKKQFFDIYKNERL